jgi:hypothetical protein
MITGITIGITINAMKISLYLNLSLVTAAAAIVPIISDNITVRAATPKLLTKHSIH